VRYVTTALGAVVAASATVQVWRKLVTTTCAAQTATTHLGAVEKVTVGAARARVPAGYSRYNLNKGLFLLPDRNDHSLRCYRLNRRTRRNL
jgi:hypothetical protein